VLSDGEPDLKIAQQFSGERPVHGCTGQLFARSRMRERKKGSIPAAPMNKIQKDASAVMSSFLLRLNYLNRNH
jgi:hypothetical protein